MRMEVWNIGLCYALILFALRKAYDYVCPRQLLKARSNIWDLACTLFMLAKVVGITWWSDAYVSMDRCQVPQRERIAVFDDYIMTEMGWFISTFAYDALNGSCDAEMVFHHVLAIAIAMASTHANVTCLGFALVPYMLASNPLQHLVKTLHKLLPQSDVTKFVFIMFAAAFFASRVVMFPIYYIYPLFFLNIGFVFYPMLVMLYCLQVFWFAKIAKIMVANIGFSFAI